MNGKRSGRLILKQVIQWRLLLLLDNRQTHKVPPMLGYVQNSILCFNSQFSFSMKCSSACREVGMNPRLIMDSWSTSTLSPSQQDAQGFRYFTQQHLSLLAFINVRSKEMTHNSPASTFTSTEREMTNILMSLMSLLSNV